MAPTSEKQQNLAPNPREGDSPFERPHSKSFSPRVFFIRPGKIGRLFLKTNDLEDLIHGVKPDGKTVDLPPGSFEPPCVLKPLLAFILLIPFREFPFLLGEGGS